MQETLHTQIKKGFAGGRSVTKRGTEPPGGGGDIKA